MEEHYGIVAGGDPINYIDPFGLSPLVGTLPQVSPPPFTQADDISPLTPGQWADLQSDIGTLGTINSVYQSVLKSMVSGQFLSNMPVSIILVKNFVVTVVGEWRGSNLYS